MLYEPAWPHVIGKEALARLEKLAQVGDWEDLAVTFFRDKLSVPVEELDELRVTDLWPPIVADAEASLGDLRALSRYDFKAERFRELWLPVMLQIGTESPRVLYGTDALAAVLPDVRIEELPGHAHEAMTTTQDVCGSGRTCCSTCASTSARAGGRKLRQRRFFSETQPHVSIC